MDLKEEDSIESNSSNNSNSDNESSNNCTKKTQKSNAEIFDMNQKNNNSSESKIKKQKYSDSSENKSKNCNGVFIDGIPYTTTEKELKELFSPFGEITTIKLPKYQDTGRNIGYCHIYYTNANSASKALKLDKYTIGKRFLNVSLAKKNFDELNETKKINPNNVPIDCLTAFIKNLPYEISEKEVGDKFRSCGKIKSIRFVYNSQTKKFKGFCYIDFKEHNALLKALELNGKMLSGRKLQVDFEQSKPKKGYKVNYENLDSKYNKEKITMLNRKRKIHNKK